MNKVSLKSHVRRVAIAGAAIAVGAMVWAAPADAASNGVAGRVTTGGVKLNVRSAPTTGAKAVGTVKNGAVVKLVCAVKGSKVAGHRRTTVYWDKLSTGGYVSDGYIKRGKKLPACATKKVRSTEISAKGWVRPLPDEVTVGSGFHTKARPDHDGVDMSSSKGVKIRAAAAGKVMVSECNASYWSKAAKKYKPYTCDSDGSPRIMGCGWYVDIKHAGNVVTRYCHMLKRPYVKVGDTVEAGQVIGLMGTSGNSSGPHLHFETHQLSKGKTWAQRSTAVSPIAFMKARGVKL
jgi:murein DD-endopeptidase MepM/ murein hydrolase activator NlpD